MIGLSLVILGLIASEIQRLTKVMYPICVHYSGNTRMLFKMAARKKPEAESEIRKKLVHPQPDC